MREIRGDEHVVRGGAIERDITRTRQADNLRRPERGRGELVDVHRMDRALNLGVGVRSVKELVTVNHIARTGAHEHVDREPDEARRRKLGGVGIRGDSGRGGRAVHGTRHEGNVPPLGESAEKGELITVEDITNETREHVGASASRENIHRRSTERLGAISLGDALLL